MQQRTVFLVALAAALGCSRRRLCPLGPSGSSFSAHVDNPWFPLKPGTRYVYSGVRTEAIRDVVTVTHRTTMIDGASCIVVDDHLFERGTLAERTTDWYSQDARGNVWYFGEDSASSMHAAT